MKKQVLSILILGLSLSFCTAQTEKIVLAIMPFTVEEGQGTGTALVTGWLNEGVSGAFNKSNRFTVVDRTSLKSVAAEQETQKGERFMGGKTVAQDKGLGAKFIVTGTLKSYTATENRDSKGQFIGYSASVYFEIKVVDVETGELIASNSFKGGSGNGLLGILGGSLTLAQTTDGAVNNAVGDGCKDVFNWTKKAFPVTVSIVEIQEKDDKKGAKKILIAGGYGIGLEKGDELKVYEIKEVTVDGKTLNRNVEIGKLKVSKVEDENFSICTVKDGGLEILAKLTANVKLKVVTVK